DRFLHGVEDGPALVRGSPLAGRHATHHLGSVSRAGLGVECAFASGEALHDQSSIFIYQNRHDCSLLSNSPIIRRFTVMDRWRGAPQPTLSPLPLLSPPRLSLSPRQ